MLRLASQGKANIPISENRFPDDDDDVYTQHAAGPRERGNRANRRRVVEDSGLELVEWFSRERRSSIGTKLRRLLVHSAVDPEARAK